jgi:hypothetical protein
LFIYTGVTDDEQKLGTFNYADYEWAQIVEELAKNSPEGAAKLYVSALTSDKFNLARSVEKHLIKLLPEHTPVVAEELSKSCQADETRFLHFTFHGAASIVKAFNADAFLGWLKSQPEKVVVMFARNLPKPTKDDNGVVELPAITLKAVEMFGGNAGIMGELIAGQTSYGPMSIYPGAFEEIAALYDPFHSDDNGHVRKWAKAISKSYRAYEESYRQELEERELER